MKYSIKLHKTAFVAVLTIILFIVATTPIAKANDTPFSDVDKFSSHYENINQAYERKLINGYADGTYHPNDSLKRSHVTKILANYVTTKAGFTNYDAYIEKYGLHNKVTPFRDVSKQGDIELYKASLIVKFAGVFNGSNNHLMPSDGINRQQMAKVLVNAFELQPVEGSRLNVIDLDEAHREYIPFIQILAENKVTTVSKYNPKGFVTRGQIASFLNRSYDSVNGVEEKLPTPLEQPTKESIFVQGIELGDTQNDIQSKFGQAKRISGNEFKVDWHAYHNNYKDFFMVSYDEKQQVNGLYTNYPLVTSTVGIQLGLTKTDIRKKMGTPLSVIPYGVGYYTVNNNPLVDYYDIGNSYVVLFYDQHNGFKIDAVQIVLKELQQNRNLYYTSQSTSLRDSFEWQLFDLTNALRVKWGSPALQHHKGLQEVARLHSEDMAQNNFFDHRNLQGQSPSDRMNAYGIQWATYAENISHGYQSSIFSHHGLLNSIGHRNNILRTSVTHLGTGVGYDSKNAPYFTEKFMKH